MAERVCVSHDWNHLLICPVCRASLSVTESCAHCGERFEIVEGTPRLMSERAATTVSFPFSSARSVVPDELKRRVLNYAPTNTTGQLPYHMDAAQATALTKLPTGSLVLEIGCGGGQNRTWMKSLGLNYLGTDVSKTRVYAHLQAHGGPDMLADAHFLPIKNDCIDCVYAAAVNEHLASPIQAALEARRVLKPGGMYLGNCSFMEPWHDESFFHMSPNGVIELLLASGFDIDFVYPGRGWHGFKALPRMAFMGPMRSFAVLGNLFNAAYKAQVAFANMRRRSKGRPPHSPLLVDAKVAGAMTWIARKPAAPLTRGNEASA
jgi:SAM-dependent methyltransferase